MDESIPVNTILQLKKDFVIYNIKRIRELLRYLPDKKIDLFENIPVWLHVNIPGIPGYIDRLNSPRGIYRFHDSGFYKKAIIKYNKLKEKLLQQQNGDEYISGVYLMGSAGTLAQTESSDFDYWIIINPKIRDDSAQNFLMQKLDRIVKWSLEKYNQEVNFFILSQRDVKENKFSAIDEESSGSSQRSFLKEEFYRTFIMIAGKIPYWAVLPPQTSEKIYTRSIFKAEISKNLNFVSDDYIDLGNLQGIDKKECLGAILWQLYKAIKYPVKSLIKSALIACYYFANPKEMLLCDQIRKSFYKTKNQSILFDPYAIVFDTVINFFSAMEDEEGTQLIKECIFNRLFSADNEKTFYQNPKGSLLRRYLSEWDWNYKNTQKMDQLCEADRIAFEERIYKKIFFLYELVLRDHGENVPYIAMKENELSILKNNISAALKKKDQKLPRCSAYLRSNREQLSLKIQLMKKTSAAEHWYVTYELSKNKRNDSLVFEAEELLRVFGWLIENGFFSEKIKHIEFISYYSSMSHAKIMTLFEAATLFFSHVTSSNEEMIKEPVWERIILMPCVPFARNEFLLKSADMLLINSWKEIFFNKIDLSGIRTFDLQCKKVSQIIKELAVKSYQKELPYFISGFSKSITLSIQEKIAYHIEHDNFKNGSVLPEETSFVDLDFENEDLPFLDLT